MDDQLVEAQNHAPTVMDSEAIDALFASSAEEGDSDCDCDCVDEC